ncbi:MAG: hypothetical protein K2G90_02900 [Muribaculaceae bacterium]|nr:hypothetical protein [Muribaculaceae bacterium]
MTLKSEEYLYDWEESDVAPLIPKVEDFVTRISHLINLKTEEIKTDEI